MMGVLGVPDADARLVADTLVRTDLWGHQSHCLLRLPWYVDRILSGVMYPVTSPEVVVDMDRGVAPRRPWEAIHGPLPLLAVVADQ
jgi:LDH2 family malate/lactate/ureidoglycolate dehydrogenase